uniref:PH domain-containing protein n=1 Tax=Strigamia maritima TaxID=126957 RepID=T1IIA9_STRMM
MLGIEKLHLEDALDDSPQMRSLVSVFEQDTSQLKKYTTTLRDYCQRVLDAESEVSNATRCLSEHLKSYEKINFPLESDKESVLSSTMKEFANTLDEISSWHHILATEMNDGMMFPITKFLQADLEEVNTMCELYQAASNDLEKAITKYCKIQRKKEAEKDRMDANEEVYLMRKKFHQISLHYYASLNALQYKRKTALIEPFLGYLHAQRAHFGLGKEALMVPDLDNFLANISASVHGVHTELGLETKKTVNLIDTIENQSQHLYHGEPTLDAPLIPAHLNMTKKCGYLQMRTKVAGVMSKWEKAYFFTEGGNFICVNKGQIGGSLLMPLDRMVVVAPLDQEDRRFVFQITSGKNNFFSSVFGECRTVVVQAMNDRDREEWIATIRNIIQEEMNCVKDKPTRSQTQLLSKSQFFTSCDATLVRKNSDPTGRAKNSKTPPARPPLPRPAAPENDLSSTPIVFDMISPSEESKLTRPGKEGPPIRINPFDQSSDALATEILRGETPFHEAYTVRFLGSMEVRWDRGEQLVHQVIRAIMAARAIHNVFKMTELHMVISNEALRLIDPGNQSIRAEFILEDLAFWAAHKENNRRSEDAGTEPKFSCHVFESNSSGEEKY